MGQVRAVRHRTLPAVPGDSAAMPNPYPTLTPAENLKAILASPSYLRAYEDIALMHRVELRPVRLQLELLKPEMLLQENEIESTVVLFGGARITESDESERR